MEYVYGTAISIHALREEGDPIGWADTQEDEDFYPRPPRGGRPSSPRFSKSSPGFLSTPSARRATGRGEVVGLYYRISIHALREEGDHVSPAHADRGDGFLSTPSARRATSGLPAPRLWLWNFYPRPPRGGRLGFTRMVVQPSTFLSTPSARRATVRFLVCSSRTIYFYPRPPRGGRRDHHDRPDGL